MKYAVPAFKCRDKNCFNPSIYNASSVSVQEITDHLLGVRAECHVSELKERGIEDCRG